MRFIRYQRPKKWNANKEKWQTDTIYLYTIVKTKYEIFRGYPSTKYIVDTNTEYSVQSPINDLVRAVNGLLQLLRKCFDKKVISDYLMELRPKRGSKKTISVG